MNTMKKLAGAVMVGVAATGAQAQPTIDWYTVDGGGGTSAGGVFEVSGTIGQPDAGVMSGGQFTLTGGFWVFGGGGSPGCDPDVNCDGVPDQGDVACIILAVAGDMSCYCQADPDFNRDGVPDQGDVADLILTVAGAPCP